jgi:hypothetical protein
MTLGLRLALYTGITAGLVYGLASGVRWLVTPDPELLRHAHAKPAPIPPRIAESIERRIPLPVQEPPPPLRVAPPPPPAMQEAPVSLHPVPAVERKPQRRAVKVTRGSRSRTADPVSEIYMVPVITTGRTDAPF